MNILFHIILAISFFVSGKEKKPIETVYPFQLGDKIIHVVVTEYYGRDNLVMINLHDNERTSVNAGKKILQEKGGMLIHIKNDSSRNISFNHNGLKFEFDPNRIFTKKGVEESLRKYGWATPQAVEIVWRFADSLLTKIPSDIETVIALHNNTDSNFSICSYLPGGDEVKAAKQVFMNYEKDPDDFFLATTHQLFIKVSSKGFNAILQKNEDLPDDGSLSVYLKDKSYINVEAEHGHEEEQTKMLQYLLK